MSRLALAVTELALPLGLMWRPATMGDAEAVTELVAVCEIAATGEREIEVEDVRSEWRRASVHLEDDTVLVFDGSRLVGAAQVVGARYLAVDVHPDVRERDIASALLRWGEARSRRQGAVTIGQTVPDSDTWTRDLFLANGYAPFWTSWALEMRLDGEPETPIIPPGASIRPAAVETEDRAIHALLEAAFGEWESRPPTPFEDWRAWAIGRGGFEPWWLPVAVDGDEIVGVAYLVPYPDIGWVMQIAVRRSHRGRGLGQALLKHACREFHLRGFRLAGVSTDSRTGALGLYEHVGMKVARSYTHYAKEL